MLAPPIIDTQVYVCSNLVRVYNLVAGSQITVFLRSKKRKTIEKLGELQAGGGVALVPLDPSINLTAGDELYAEAWTQNDHSPQSIPVPVLAVPTVISPPLTFSVLYAGGTCLGARGAIFGSLVEVWNGSESLGQAEFYDELGVAIPLTRALKTSDAVQVEATLGGQPSGRPFAPLTPVMPFGTGPYAETIPPPRVNPPPLPCQNARLEGCLLGAKVELFDQGLHDPVPGPCVREFEWGFPTVTVPPNKILQDKDQLRAQQHFAALNLHSGYSDPVDVVRPDKLPPPDFKEFVFEGASRVTLVGVLENARVELAVFRDNSEDPHQRLGDGVFVDYHPGGDYDPGVGEFTAGWWIWARQLLCGQKSDWAKTPVAAHFRSVPPLIVETPLYNCATWVQVRGRLSGAWVEVRVDNSPLKPVQSSRVKVPTLVKDQEVTAYQILGKHRSDVSNNPKVIDILELPDPELSLPWEYNTALLTKLVPGAWVEVFWKNLILAGFEAVESKTQVPLYPIPWPGAEIRARQRLCQKQAESAPFKVQGKIAVVHLTGTTRLSPSGVPLEHSAYVPNSLVVEVRTQLQVPQNLEVTLISSDTAVADVVPPGQATIKSGTFSAFFNLQTKQPGVTYLEVQAQDYQQCTPWWSVENDSRYELAVHGRFEVSPSSQTLTEGDHFDLQVTVVPTPPDGKIILEHWPQPPNTYAPKIVDLPPGKNTVIETYQALPPGSAPVSVPVVATRSTGNPPPGVPDQWLILRDGKHPTYDPAACFITVNPKPSTIPPGTKSATVTFTLLYTQYNQVGPPPYQVKGTLVKVKNLDNYQVQLIRVGNLTGWTVPASGESPISFQNNDILNGWYLKMETPLQITEFPGVIRLEFHYNPA